MGRGEEEEGFKMTVWGLTTYRPQRVRINANETSSSMNDGQISVDKYIKVHGGDDTEGVTERVKSRNSSVCK